MNYFVKTPKILHTIYKDAVWVLPNNCNEVYLTFDDGPVPIITEQCLDILAREHVLATFFCVGENVIKHPEIYQRILAEGHQVGNHSFNHLKGWSTDNHVYFENVAQCSELVHTRLFRPPYGKIKRSQLKELAKDYKVIMWDVLSADFDPKNSVTKIVSNVVNKTEAGSIIVMHDNEKCGNRMLKALPAVITQLKDKGFSFGLIK